ncbi:Major facilitator superfamily transporter [Desulfonema limicola]|uniref:Major facilitator superfamily transporter n=1 Tax=Desulfonema limicola TaxID=45656 RepID=A0A975BBG8_9BACT|nr:MFS transporter [Desulfonema limicola]QTA82164.1 Major facilitator superfamily transporter [Desulfonema limicola]
MQDAEINDCPMPEPFRAKITITLFAAWLFYLGFVTRVMFAPLMPAIEQDLKISHSQAGSLFLMMSIGYLIAPLCSGLISSKINHRGTLNISAWAVGLALIPFAFVKNIWIIRLLLMIIGLAAGIHLPSAIATITAEIKKEDWGKALSVHQSAPPLSFVSAPLIAALLMNWLTWRIVLLTWSAAALLTALAYSLKGKGGDFPGRIPNLGNVKYIAGKPSFWIMVILFAMAMGGNAGIYAMLPLFLVTDHGMELTKANTLIGLSQLSGLIMVFAAGWITDKIGQKPAMAVTLLTAGISTFLLGILKDQWLVIIIFIQPALLSSFFLRHLVLCHALLRHP